MKIMANTFESKLLLAQQLVIESMVQHSFLQNISA